MGNQDLINVLKGEISVLKDSEHIHDLLMDTNGILDGEVTKLLVVDIYHKLSDLEERVFTLEAAINN